MLHFVDLQTQYVFMITDLKLPQVRKYILFFLIYNGLTQICTK
jgi:hypothetical protein